MLRREGVVNGRHQLANIARKPQEPTRVAFTDIIAKFDEGDVQDRSGRAASLPDPQRPALQPVWPHVDAPRMSMRASTVTASNVVLGLFLSRTR